VTGIDLVVEQLRVAAGEKLSFSQEDVMARGHAIEVRLNAEDPSFQFMPSPGYLEKFNLPSGPFIRIDSGFTVGDTITPYYDSLLAKVISWGRTREESLSRMRRALYEMEVVGVKTTSSFLLQVIDSPGFIDGSYDTLFLES
jgi:acetyl-CoA carboxylase biotin carboxylase subunit